jgi:hypothetical protein
MRKLIFIGKSVSLTLLILCAFFVKSQTITTNRNVVGMEHNLLFNATNRFTVTQTGNATVDLDRLFDGKFQPSYSGNGVTTNTPTVILIEDLPNHHTQAKAIIGWSTRYWNAKNFKIEGYNVYGTEGWRTLADYTSIDYSSFEFQMQLPSGSYTKLRFTFYSAAGVNGRIGLSEIFFLHPEVSFPYYGLKHGWELREDDLYRRTGNVGIGIDDPKAKLHVDGNILAKEIKVEAQTADFVFEDNYQLKDLSEVEEFITTNKHLPDIPSAKQMKENGVGLSEMNKLLLQKVEELTLYVISLEKNQKQQQNHNNKLEQKISELCNQIKSLKNE